jgi:2-oxoglutarate ferredoxin oxidoreductase subunit alpha
MTDLDIGMNHRLCRPLKWDDTRNYDRGKIMTAAMLEAGKDFGRYLDVDGDGIPSAPPRHAPDQGLVLHPRHLARPLCALHRGRRAYADNMQRLLRKFETAKTWCRARCGATPRQAARYGVDLLRLDLAGDGRGDRT